jgi:hypothetical protein
MYAIIFHAHQKLDRVAYRHLRTLLPPGSFFPSIKQVMHFEAGQGPDNSKLKRQLHGEQPWHFVNPFDPADTDLHQQIKRHYDNLVRALTKQDDVRSAFEAAWLAHALVDGLTPAHHFPYEAELSRLRGGEERHSRKGLLGRVYVKSDTVTKSVLQSMKLVGPKGLLTTHAMFEAGAWAIIRPLPFTKAVPTAREMKQVTSDGVVEVFKQLAREVAEFNLYQRFYALGWTQSVSRDVRKELAPRMIRMITLAWYAASQEAAGRRPA